MSSRIVRRSIYGTTATTTNGVSQQVVTQLETKLTEQTNKLVTRLAYTESYLKMIDEAIAIEGFTGWSPPT